MGRKLVYSALLIVAVLALAIGCTKQTESSPARATTPPATARPASAIQDYQALGPQNFNQVSCWYKGKEVYYYDFGTNTPLVNGVPTVAPIWVLIYGNKADGTPDFVAGGHNVIDVIPGDPGYSDLWQVMLVTVPRSYQPDSLTSAADVMARNFPTQTTMMFVNCPVVPAGSTIQDNRPLIQCWYKGQKAYYYDFGANDDVAAPIWAFITGFDSNNKPIFLAGQHNIVDVVPGDKGYSAFWKVNLVTVPSVYAPDTLRSVDDVMKSGYPVTPTNVNVNCPL